MSIHYTFTLCVGFEFSEKNVLKLITKQKKINGKFHFEQRFDPKTGQKLEDVKIWDKEPEIEEWIEIDDKKFDDLDPLEPENIIEILEDHFKCNVEFNGEFNSKNGKYTFFVNDLIKNNDLNDFHNVNVINYQMNFEDILSLKPKLDELKNKLIKFGFKPKSAKVFIADRWWT